MHAEATRAPIEFVTHESKLPSPTQTTTVDKTRPEMNVPFENPDLAGRSIDEMPFLYPYRRHRRMIL